MLSKLSRFLTVITLSIMLSLSLALPVSAGGVCPIPPSYPAYAKWVVAEAGDFKVENGRLFICINGNWQDYGPFDDDDDLPSPVNGRIVAEPNSTLQGNGDIWEAIDEKKAYSAALEDPNGRTGADTVGGFYTREYTVFDPISGEAYTQSEATIRLSGRNLTPGATYYAFATKTMWDQTPYDGWNVQTGEAAQMQNSDGSYTSAVATAEGTATFIVKAPVSWQGWNYGRLVKAGGGGNCSAPLQLN